MLEQAPQARAFHKAQVSPEPSSWQGQAGTQASGRVALHLPSEAVLSSGSSNGSGQVPPWGAGGQTEMHSQGDMWGASRVWLVEVTQAYLPEGRGQGGAAGGDDRWLQGLAASLDSHEEADGTHCAEPRDRSPEPSC